MSVPGNVVSVSDPQIPVSQGIFEESSTQKAKLGTRMRLGERTFYYAKASGAITAGQVVCAPQVIGSHATGVLTVAANTTVGSNQLTVTVGTLASANAYAEGYLCVASLALSGGGLMLRIKSHPVALTSASTMVVTLYDPIPTAVAAGPATLMPNPYNGVNVGSQALGQAVGVAPIAISDGYYAWIQTWGPAAPKHAGATVVNGQLVLGTVGGVVVTADATTGGGLGAVALPIGKNCGFAAVATQAHPVFLQIMP